MVTGNSEMDWMPWRECSRKAGEDQQWLNLIGYSRELCISLNAIILNLTRDTASLLLKN